MLFMIQPIYAEYSTISRWFWTPLDINLNKSTLTFFFFMIIETVVNKLIYYLEY